MLKNLVEDWRAKLDKDFVVGDIFMELSKALDCIPYDLIIEKLHTYGYDESTLVLIYSYLKRRKQCVRINNSKSSVKNVIYQEFHKVLYLLQFYSISLVMICFVLK